jgi:Tfp pilus assembly protein FimT
MLPAERDERMRIRMKRQAGHSLVEIVAVIVIIGIISYMAMARLSGTSETVNEKALARKVINDIGYAKEMAVSFRQTVQFVVDPVQNRYWLQWAGGGYLLTPVAEANFIVQADDGYFNTVSITATGFSNGILEFDATGQPFDNGMLLDTETTAVELNGATQVIIIPGTGVGYIGE